MPRGEGYENATAYVVSLCLVFTICVALLRLWIRKSAYGRDDAVIGAATLLSFGHTAASYAALKFGLGKRWVAVEDGASADLDKLDQASLAGIILFFAALYLSKCAMLAFLRRITKTRSQVLLYHICTGAVGALGLLSMIIATAGCPTESGYYWAFHWNASSCPSQSARWQTLTGLDIVTEILLLVLPIHLVWNLQMPLSKKAMITVAFWVRLPALGFSLGRNYYTLQLQQSDSSPTFDSALVVIWMEVELAYAIGASTLSAMKSFTESANTGFGLGFTRGKADDCYGLSNVSASSGATRTDKDSKCASGSQSQPSEHVRKPCHAVTRPKAHGTSVEEPALKLRPERGIATYTSVSAEPIGNGGQNVWRANSSVGSDTSRENDLVILRETGYDVQHDRAPMLPVAELRA
ncbi:Hypothetical predicted protein [Lecanosticta acicola]|uniref:Rhodopsin domain-containing protein n=1 Tax=Lecanosticta acicola TaxID=111012 RepID=A0AAI8Z398_9PEZI|nr:Hypothetical predicted protein [Lecanosticta acicola]